MDLRRVLRLGGDHHDSSSVGSSWSIEVTASISTTSLPCAVRSVKPALSDCRGVRRSGHQHDGGPALAQTATDHTANGTRSVDDHPHRGIVRCRGVFHAHPSEREALVAGRPNVLN